MRDTLLIIPAHNEELNISKVLNELYSYNLDLDILVVNDGSTDKTRVILENQRVKSISLPYNLGYGGAVQTGFKYAVMKGYRYIIQFDGDGQHDSGDIPLILSKLKESGADIVIGSRFLGRGSFRTGLFKKLAIQLFRLIIKTFTGVKITDPSSGLQGLSKRAFTHYADMGHYPNDYPDADILIHMILSKYRIIEIPANIRARNGGKSMHSGVKPVFYILKMLVSILIVLLREKIPAEECE